MTDRGISVAVVPAKDEAERIAATVRALHQVEQVGHVVVVDDGSSDDTAQLAREAGAVVVTHARNRGKAAAMTTGAATAAEQGWGELPLLFVDADLEESAAAVGVLVTPVTSGDADMTIAVLPAQSGPGGGRGFVVRLSREGIKEFTGWNATQPLSGMRCLNRKAFEVAQPFARGWGVETGMTIDVLRAGLRVSEVPCAIQHRVTGTDLRGQVHRAAQYRDVALALLVRRMRRAAQARLPHRRRDGGADTPDGGARS